MTNSRDIIPKNRQKSVQVWRFMKHSTNSRVSEIPVSLSLNGSVKMYHCTSTKSNGPQSLKLALLNVLEPLPMPLILSGSLITPRITRPIRPG